MRQLKVFQNNYLIKLFNIDDNKTYTLGSLLSNEPNYLCINFPTISKRHLKIQIENKNIWITDLESKNGTHAGTKKLKPNLPYLLKEEEKIKLSHIDILISKISENKNLFQITEEFNKLNTNGCTDSFEQLIKNNKEFFSLNNEMLFNLEQEYYGDGPLKDILKENKFKDLLINAHNEIFIDQGNGLIKSSLAFLSETTYTQWVHRLLQTNHIQLDYRTAFYDGTLNNGARLHVALPPNSGQQACVSIRNFTANQITENEALNRKWFTQNELKELKKIISQRKNVIISGGTSTGKTSLLNFLCRYIDQNDRIISIEDTRELELQNQNWVSLESRKENADNIGSISLRECLKASLRMRPDRIILGECRGEEVFELLQAFNTGHSGCFSTIHANSCTDALNRIEFLASLNASNIPANRLRSWIEHSIHTIIQLERTSDGHRRICEIKSIQ